jgi:hypothetical protein
MEKMELRMTEGPTIQGSTSIVKDPGNKPGDESGATGGLKMRRKDVSPLSDLMVKDMATDAGSTLLCRVAARGKA